tara:strand:+ start:1794 stop:2051 length:258 start_codon:yes stop_codon:yes gene_type:complete
MTRRKSFLLTKEITEALREKDYYFIKFSLDNIHHQDVLRSITLLRSTNIYKNNFIQEWNKQLDYAKRLCKENCLDPNKILRGLLK